MKENVTVDIEGLKYKIGIRGKVFYWDGGEWRLSMTMKAEKVIDTYLKRLAKPTTTKRRSRICV